MATTEIRRALDGTATFTITVSSLATATARQSTMVSNSSERPASLVYVDMESGGTGPTAGSVYEGYLLRGDGTYRTDAAGATDAAITIENAPLLGTIVLTNTANKHFYGDFDTAALGSLGVEWGIAVLNSSGQTTHATAGNFRLAYTAYVPEIQA